MKRTLAKHALYVLLATLSCGCGLWQQRPSAVLVLDLSLHESMAVKTIRPGSARSLAPSEAWTPSSYRVSGSGPGGANFLLESGQTQIRENLVPGAWSIAVEALAPSRAVVAGGTVDCVLEPSRQTKVALLLGPIAGEGSLHLSFALNLTVEPGGSFRGTLTYQGLPGADQSEGQPPIEFLAPDSDPQAGYEALTAGQYTLGLRYTDTQGNLVGGCSETLLVLSGFDTSGTCLIELGEPELSVEAEVLDFSPLDAPLVSVPCLVADLGQFHPLSLPAPRPASASQTRKAWLVAGAEERGAAEVLRSPGDVFPDGLWVMERASEAASCLNRARFDFVETCAVEARAGSSHTWAERREASGAAGFSWIASFDSRVLEVAGFGSGQTAYVGLPPRSAVGAIDGSPAGLVVVSGLDEASAIHLFAAPYGAEIKSPSAIAKVPIQSPWLRLWKDKIKIGSSLRTADRLALSRDGRWLAAASSSSNWLRLYSLAPDGAMAASFSLTSAASGLEGLDGVKALSFVEDSAQPQLLALCSASKSVLVFDCAPAPTLAASIQLEAPTYQGSLSLQDIAVLSGAEVVASASEASKLYILGKDGGNWGLRTVLLGSSGSELRKPGPIAASFSGDGFYVLCDKTSLLHYERTEPWTFSLVGTLPLSSEASGATTLSAGREEENGGDLLFVAGGEVAARIAPAYAGLPEGEIDLEPIGSGVDGIATAEGSCFLRGAFLLGGGSSGYVGVFGPR